MPIPRNPILPGYYLPYKVACVTFVIYSLDIYMFIFSMIVPNTEPLCSKYKQHLLTHTALLCLCVCFFLRTQT